MHPDSSLPLIETIRQHLDEPAYLEQLYRSNRRAFRSAFLELYPSVSESAVARFWHARLSEPRETATTETRSDWTLLIAGCLIAGLIVKLSDWLGLDRNDYLPRNLSFVILPLLAAWFGWQRGLTRQQWLAIAAAFVVSAIFINLIPGNNDRQTFYLACLHLPIMLWGFAGMAHTGENWRNPVKRIAFLRFNGDWVVMSALLFLAAGLLTAITIALFELIDIRLEHFMEQWGLVWGLPAIPLVAAFLVTTKPGLVERVSPVIARIFTPVVLVMLVIYLISVAVAGKNPFRDRDFLLIFNILLIAVMALILFSVSASKAEMSRRPVVLLGLAVVTIVINTIALTAIIFRIAEWGFTPNRLAVLGSNLLILVHLITVGLALWENIRGKAPLEAVERRIAAWLPAYVAWAAVVVFLFPLIFRFA